MNLKLILILGILTPGIGYSQIQKGKFFVIGSMGYSKSVDKNSFLSNPGAPPNLQISSFSGFSSINYFISDRISVGPILGWDFRKASYSEIIDVNPFTYSGVFEGRDRRLNIGVNIRYFHPISHRLYLYFSASGSRALLRQQVEYENDEYIQDGRGILLLGIPGIIYTLNERWVVNFSIGEITYEKLFPKNEPELHLSEFDTKFDLSTFKIGVQFHLGKRNEKETKSEEILVPLFDEND
jgi:hypothetical protein